MEPTEHSVEIFGRYRSRLFGIAYRMLGSVQDAEDVLQEAYLRWHQEDVDAVRSPEAWLVAVVSRLSIDRLRRAATERAAYEGSWLPEPIATGDLASAGHRAELASDLSMAFLVPLERLSPDERAAFLLREIFDCDYAEMARMLERSEAACRQLVHRARARVRQGEPRFAVAPETRERLIERLLAALAAGDRDGLLQLLAEDVSWTADGGGKVPSTRRVLRGADRVVRFLLGVERKWKEIATHRMAWLNGEQAIVTEIGGQVAAITALETDGERILAFYRVLNPDKLRHVAARDG